MKQSKAAWSKAAALIQNECANYQQQTKECIPLDCLCPQLHSPLLFREQGKVLCKYFSKNVLPLDKALLLQVKGAEHLRACAVCGKRFSPASNRAKYCEACRKKVQRKQQAKYEREKYAKKRVSFS